MKKLIYLTAIVSLAFSSHAELRKHKYSEEERQAQREKFRAATGGLVFDTRKVGVAVSIINTQDVVKEDFLRARTDYYSGRIFCKVVYCHTNATVNLVNAKNIVSSFQGAGGVLLVANDELPTLVVLPESKAAIVNVKALSVDSPTEETLQARVSKELTRAIAFTLGVGYSERSGGPMSPISSLKDLDAIMADGFSNDTIMSITKFVNRMGIGHYRRTTYLKACEEGWASPPADEYQKAIWDKVHALPTEPIKIKPETTKQK